MRCARTIVAIYVVCKCVVPVSGQCANAHLPWFGQDLVLVMTAFIRVPGNLDSCVCTHTTLPQLYSTRGIVVVLNLVAELNLLVLNLNLVPLERYCNTRGMLDCARHILRELAHGPQRIWIGGVI